jgi:MFS family permease
MLVIAHFAQAIGWAAMLLFPLYLAQLGASRAEIGTIMGSSAIGGLLLRPVIGWALDHKGRRPTLAVGTVIASVAMVGVMFVDEVNWLPYAMRFVFGIGTAATFSGYFTFCTDIVPASRRTEGIALFGISGLVPLAINPLATDMGISAADVRWFLPLLSVVFLSSLVPLSAVPEPTHIATGQPRSGLFDTLKVLRSRPLWPVWLVTIAFSSLVMVFIAFASVCAANRELGKPTAFWLTYSAGAIAVRAFGARLPDRLGSHNIVAPAVGLCVAGALIMAEARDMATLQIAGLLGGMGHGYCFPVLTTQVTERTPLAVRGSALSAFTALWDLSFLFAPPLLGYLADRTSDATMFTTAATIGLMMMAVWVVMEHFLAPNPTEANTRQDD